MGMVEGDKWELYIPSDIAYGDSGSPPKIGPGDALIFTLELLKIEGSTCEISTLKGCDDKEKDYIKKAQKEYGGDVDIIEEEMERLDEVMKKIVSEELKLWGEKRRRILTNLLEVAELGNN